MALSFFHREGTYPYTFGALALVWPCTSPRSESTRLEDAGSRGPGKMLVRRRVDGFESCRSSPLFFIEESPKLK